MSPASALGYLFWTRHRRGLTLLGGYWLVVMIFCLTSPAGYFKFAADKELWYQWLALVVYLLLCCTFLGAVGHLIHIFTFSRDARPDACESGFPARLWTLPLPTRTLVGWPMLWGSATMILGWVTLAWSASRPYGVEVPLAWPALELAAFLAWLQAIMWMPFPLPWLRVFLVIPVAAILLGSPIAVLSLKVPSLVVSSVLALLLPAAYLTAIWGVDRVRRGDNVPWGWPAWLRWPWASMGTRRPFTSMIQAQRWFEWRSYGRAFPIVVACLAVIELPLIPFIASFLDDADSISHPIVPPWLLHQVGSLWLVLFGFLVGMPLLAAAHSIEMGRFGKKTYRLPSFLGTRPVSEAMLIRAKFESAAWSTLAGWGVFSLGLLFWFALGGHAAEAARQFEAMRQRQPTGLFWGWLILLVVGSLVLTWLQMVQGMWIGLTKESGYSLIVVILLIVSGTAIFLSILFGIWPVLLSEYRPVLIRLLPWLAGAAAVLKSLAAAWSWRVLRRRRLIPYRILWGVLAIWLTLAAGLFAALYALLPTDYFSLPIVVLGMVLLLPLTRLALAPLALSWNRHR